MFEIRKAKEEDCKKYFELVNDALVRQNSIQNSKIPWEVHKKWFAQKLTTTSSLMLVAEINNMFLGQVRFDFDASAAVWYIDYSIIKNYRGKGYAKTLLTESVEFLRKDVGGKCALIAQVRTENHPSKKVFESLGFETAKQDLVTTFYSKQFD